MKFLVVASAALALCACSGNGGSATFRLEPASAHVTAAGAAVTFTVIVTAGKAGAVAWNLDGLGRMQVASDMMSAIYTPPDAVEAATTATISAEMAGRELSARITIDPMPAITGRVVGLDGAPFANAVVMADSGSPTTTDASGSFAIAGVKAPYAIAATDLASKYAVVYLGLRRTDPTLVLGIPAGSTLSAVVAGTVRSDLGSPRVTRVTFDAPGCTGFTDARADGGYELGFQWPGPAPSVSGVLHALEWTADGAGRPVTYSGAASLAHEAPPDHAYGRDLTLTGIGMDTLSGATSEPVGLHLDVVYANGGRIPLLSPLTWDPSGSSFSYKTPRIDGTLEIIGLSQYAGGGERILHRAGLASNETGIMLNPAALPWPIEPAIGATVTRSTVFSWYAFGVPKPMYMIAFRSTSAGGAAVDVITSSQQLALDAASSLGLAPPAGTYTWEVKATTAVTSPDEAAGPAGFYAKTNDYQTAHTGPRTLTYVP